VRPNRRHRPAAYRTGSPAAEQPPKPYRISAWHSRAAEDENFLHWIGWANVGAVLFGLAVLGLARAPIVWWSHRRSDRPASPADARRQGGWAEGL